jgi:predicted MFS family arabinose efflux permease
LNRKNEAPFLGNLTQHGKIGSIPAAWIAGILYENYGFHAPLYVQIGSVLFVAFLLFWFKDPKQS